MTIKRRLLLLNIVFVALPFLLIILMNNIMNLFVHGLSGFTVTSTPYSSLIVGFDAQENTVGNLADLDFESGGLYRLENGGYVFAIPEAVSGLFENLSESGESVAIDIGRFPQSAEIVRERFDLVERNTFWIIGGFLTFIMLFINLLFRKTLLNPVKKSIADLETGAEEIGKDNLKYRIDETCGNEFDSVYARFNEMAHRLLEMTHEKALDEMSRKELIAGISHDLKTPLTSINAYAEGLLKGVAATPESQEKYLTIIWSKAQDMTYIINQLFLFSKIDLSDFPFDVTTVDIGSEIDNLVTSFQQDYAEKDVEITLTENVKKVFVEIDVVQFKNVVQNVVGNSVKYGAQTEGKIEISCTRENHNVALRIKDNGPGVSEDGLLQLFEVFYRGDVSRNSTVKGSGLGLAISYKVIKRLKGTIEASNSPKGGLVTTIRLPILTDLKEDD